MASLVTADSSSTLSLRKPRVAVRVAPTTYSDLQGAAICELLAFSGAFPPHDHLDLALNPSRATLVRAGTHPRYWPDFNSTVRHLQHHLLSGQMLFTAFIPGDLVNSCVHPSFKAATSAGGKEVLAGLVRMTPPRDVLQRRMKEGKWKNCIVKRWLSDENDGTNRECADLFWREAAAGRKRVDPDQRYYLINMIFVHPSYQGRGVGSALLSTCTSIADVQGLPIYLESSHAGQSLYTACGFVPVDAVDFTYAGQRFTLPIMLRWPMPPPLRAKDKDVPSAMGAEQGAHGDKEEEEKGQLETATKKAAGSGWNLDYQELFQRLQRLSVMQQTTS